MFQDSLISFPDSNQTDTVIKEITDTAIFVIENDALAPLPIIQQTLPKNETFKTNSNNKKVNFSKVESNLDAKQNSQINWSLYSSSKQEINGITGLKNNRLDFDFLIFPLLLIFILLIWVKPFKNKKINQFFNLLVSNRFFDQLLREEESFLNSQNLRLFSIYFIATSILIFNGINLFAADFGIKVSWQLFLFIAFAVPILFFTKSIALFVSNILFKESETIDRYTFNMLISTKVLALLLILPVIFSSFGFLEVRKVFLLIGFSIYAIIFGLRIAKSIFIGWQTNLAPVQYIILYICTLEIAPLAILFKALIG